MEVFGTYSAQTYEPPQEIREDKITAKRPGWTLERILGCFRMIRHFVTFRLCFERSEHMSTRLAKQGRLIDRSKQVDLYL